MVSERKTHDPTNTLFDVLLDVNNSVSREPQRQALPIFLETKRAPGIGEFGALTIAHEITDIQMSLAKSKLDVLTFLHGRPGAGKSEFSEFIHQYMSHNSHSQLISWEKYGQNKAIDSGKVIITNPKLPWSHQDLLIAENEMEISINESLNIPTNQGNKHIICEIPASSEAWINGQWKGRPLGTRVINRFLTRAHQKHRPNTNGEFNMFVAGLVAGPLLQLYTESERIDKENAKTLKDGRRLRKFYGKSIPSGESEWNTIYNEGATFQQIQQTDYEEWGLIQDLKQFGFIFPIPDDEFDVLYSNQVEPMVKLLGLNEDTMRARLSRTIQRAQLLRYIVYSQPQLERKVPLSQLNLGVFLNNPNIKDLARGQSSLRSNVMDKLASRLREQSNRPLEYFEVAA